jgi:hypothetical protein
MNEFSTRFLFFVNLEMKKLLLSTLGIFLSPFLFSQILTVNSGSSVSIASGSSVSLGGLEIFVFVQFELFNYL